MNNIVVIGLGGVGSILIERLCRFLNFSSDQPPNLLLVDGDEYEQKNYERQEFTRLGNKADIKAGELEMKFPNLQIDAFEEYIDEDNVVDVIKEDDVVFLCVDNHKTRMIVSRYCENMKNVILISGGNELTDGNVQFFVRKDNKNLTCDLCKYHPEIAEPDDKLPSEMSCEELSVSEPQLYFANLGVATIMCWTYYNVVVKESYDVTQSEVYFDMRSMNAQSQTRLV
jgi:molybdopterin/thiamine biosynthesis adenylyltransferase